MSLVLGHVFSHRCIYVVAEVIWMKIMHGTKKGRDIHVGGSEFEQRQHLRVVPLLWRVPKPET